MHLPYFSTPTKYAPNDYFYQRSTRCLTRLMYIKFDLIVQNLEILSTKSHLKLRRTS